MGAATLDPVALRALVEHAQRGDRRAADRLVRQHDGWLRSVIFGVLGRSDLVDDVAQQVWSQVWERLASLKEPERLRSWLYSVARNAAIDAGQARKRKAAIALDQVGDVDRDSRTRRVVTSPGADESHELLMRCVEALPALYREPFVLRHLEDWSYAEIGALLDMPVETVETRLVRARRLLKEMLRERPAP